MSFAQWTLTIVAIVMAFFAVVDLWVLPPPGPTEEGRHLLRTEQGTRTGEEGMGSVIPFRSNTAKVFAAGLGGTAFVSIFDGAWGTEGPDPRLWYILAYFSAFPVLLLVFSCIRGMVEALRASSLVTPARHRDKLLVFLDTVLNSLQGRNRLRSKVFGDFIVQLQGAKHQVLENARSKLQETLRAVLREADTSLTELEDAVRVGISVLSDDAQSVRYVVGPGSAPAPFDRESVAFVSAVTRTARWWKRSYTKLQDTSGDAVQVELYDNSDRVVSNLPAEKLLLKDFWQHRTEDYQAFVVIPTPLGKRAPEAARTACIHIALRDEHLLELLWNIREKADGTPDFSNDYRMISWPDESKTDEPRPKSLALAAALRTVSDTIRIEVQDLSTSAISAGA